MTLEKKMERDDLLAQLPVESLEEMLSKYSLSPQERERRKRAQQRLKEAYSSIPWYKEQGEKYGDLYWESLHDSAVLSDG